MPTSFNFQRRSAYARKYGRRQQMMKTLMTQNRLIFLLASGVSLILFLRLLKQQSTSTYTMDECQRQQYIQEQDKTPNDSYIQTIFNCHSTYGKCKYHRPAHFFHSCGIGHSFAPILNEMEEERTTGRLWRDMPPISVPYVQLQSNMQMKSGRHFETHNLSMIHVHKCGGTSLITAFRDLKVHNEQDLNTSQNVYSGMHTLYSQGRSMQRSERTWNETGEFLNGAMTYQARNAWDKTNHMMVAVVRDPLERFISAVGQVTSDKFKSGKGLKEKCVKGNASDTLRCFVKLVKADGYWIDLHFAPMIMEIAFATMGKDLPVAIFPFEEVSM